MYTLFLTPEELETAIDALRDREDQTLDHMNSVPETDEVHEHLAQAAKEYGDVAAKLEGIRWEE